jgi:hypothetical protein
MRFSGAKIYYISVLYVIACRIIALYIYLIRAKIVSYINAVILISAIIYRSILFFIILIYVPYFIRASRLRFREKWMNSYFSDANFNLIFLFIKCSGREFSLDVNN